MSTVAQLDGDAVTVEAGDRVTLPLAVTNNSEVVEDYQIDIVGVPAAWTTVEPSHFTLYPGTAQQATVELHPPRSPEVPAGEFRFGVHVVPTEHPDQAVVPEAVVEVLAYLETTAELIPRTSHGRVGGKHQVAIDNRGNVPVTVLLIPAKDSDAVAVTAKPGSLTIDPGTARFADVRVKATDRLWRGQPRTLPFAVVVAPQDSPEVRLEGGHVQDPIFPPWLLKALLILLALLLLLLALWFLVLRPTIESAAQEAVAEPVQSAQADAAAAKKAATDAEESKKQAESIASKLPKTGTTTSKPTSVTVPYSRRLSTDTPSGESRSDVHPFKEGQVMNLTDFVLENPQGDSGVLTLMLDGQIILTQALESFRTTDYHFVTPILATGPVDLRLSVTCNRPGTPPDTSPAPTRCRNAVNFGGQLTKPRT